MIGKEEIELLKRNLLFFQANCKKQLAGKQEDYDNSEKVIRIIEELIEQGRIHDPMGIEAVYYYCMDKMKQESTRLNDYAKEIIDFIS